MMDFTLADQQTNKPLFFDSTPLPDPRHVSQTNFKFLNITPIALEKTISHGSTKKPHNISVFKRRPFRCEKKNVSLEFSSDQKELTSLDTDILSVKVQEILGKSVYSEKYVDISHLSNPAISNILTQTTLKSHDDSLLLNLHSAPSPTICKSHCSMSKKEMILDNPTNFDFAMNHPQESNYALIREATIVKDANKIIDVLKKIQEYRINTVTELPTSHGHQQEIDSFHFDTASEPLDCVKDTTDLELEEFDNMSNITEYYELENKSRVNLNLFCHKAPSLSSHNSSNLTKVPLISKNLQSPSLSSSFGSGSPVLIANSNFSKSIDLQIKKYLSDYLPKELSKFEQVCIRQIVAQLEKTRLTAQPKSHKEIFRSQVPSATLNDLCTKCCNCDCHGDNVAIEHQQIAEKVISNTNMKRQHLVRLGDSRHTMELAEQLDENQISFDQKRIDREQLVSSFSSVQISDFNRKTDTKSVQTSFILSSPASDSDQIVKHRSERNSKPPTAWFVTLESKEQRISNAIDDQVASNSAIGDLQDSFDRYCNQFKHRSMMRVRRIQDNAHLRVNTAKERKNEIMQTYMIKQKLEHHSQRLPVQKNTINKSRSNRRTGPTPLSPITRPGLTHHQMRLQTEKLYRKLPEVRERKTNGKREDDAKRRRLIVDIFKQRLKENAIRGKVNWPITTQVILV